MHDLNHLQLFVVCARQLNFRRAAVELGLKPATVSERLRKLEATLGMRLFNRTTRSVALTHAGADFLAKVVPALAQIDDAIGAAGRSADTPSGRIRINGPRPAIEFRLTPLLVDFMLAYPGIEVEVIAEDGLIDVVGAGFDAGIRYAEALSKDAVAISLGAPQRFVLIASPSYLAKNGTPAKPEDLVHHNCLAQIFPSGTRLSWEFERDGKATTIVPVGSLATSEPSVQLAAAIGGVGLAYLFADHCRAAIEKGEVIPLLDSWLQPFPAGYLYYSERRLMPPALRALVDFIKARRGA